MRAADTAATAAAAADDDNGMSLMHSRVLRDNG